MDYYNYTLLTKKGFFRQVFNEKTDTVELKPLSHPLPFYLQDFIEVDEDVVVSDLMNALISRKNEVDQFFSSYMRGLSISPFYDEMKKPPTGSYEFMSNVEVRWFLDIMPSRNPEYPDEISVSTKFIAIAKDIDSEEFSKSLPLSLTPLNEWRKLPIYINNEMMIDKIIIGDDKKLSNIENIASGDCEMKLIDFLGAFLQEITMYGYPEDRDKVVKSGIEFFTTDDESYSIIDKDNVVDELRFIKNKLELALEREDYETASKLKKEIDEIKHKFSIDDI